MTTGHRRVRIVAVVTIVVCVFSLPVAVTLLLRTIFYGLALVLIPLAALALVEGTWPSPTAVSLAPFP